LNICKADEILGKYIEVNIANRNLEDFKLMNDTKYKVGNSEIRLPQTHVSG
jgi:hypothetical protein